MVMNMGATSKREARRRRRKRVRKRVRGTPESPRLSVFKSSRHIYAQIIDDMSAKTLVGASSLSKELRGKIGGGGGTKSGAEIVGEFVAKRALENGIKRVVFDRNGFIYHGRIKALAETARQQGLEF